MKTFGTPKMAVVHLTNEDVITSSIIGCDGKMCNGYICNTCAECEGAYTCFSFKCTHYEE